MSIYPVEGDTITFQTNDERGIVIHVDMQSDSWGIAWCHNSDLLIPRDLPFEGSVCMGIIRFYGGLPILDDLNEVLTEIENSRRNE